MTTEPDPSTIDPVCQCWPQRPHPNGFGSALLICEQCMREVKEPLRYFRISTEYVVRQRHERTIVARTEAEALAEYERGTAWPSDYDTRHLETLEHKPTVIGPHPDERDDPNAPENYGMMQVFLARAIQSEYPWPEPTGATAEFLSRGGNGDDDMDSEEKL